MRTSSIGNCEVGDSLNTRAYVYKSKVSGLLKCMYLLRIQVNDIRLNWILWFVVYEL